MLGLRKLPQRQYVQVLARGNATLQAADLATSTPPPPAQTKPAQSKPASKDAKSSEPSSGTAEDARKKRPARWTPVRPSITLDRPRQYMRPLGRGVLPVYDLAVNYLKRDSENLQHDLADVKAELQTGGKSAAEVEKLEERIKILEIQSEINLPSVRWRARNGLGA